MIREVTGDMVFALPMDGDLMGGGGIEVSVETIGAGIEVAPQKPLGMGT